MGYVIAAIVVLLIVVAFVTFVVLNSMGKGSAKAEDGGTPGVGPDESPLGDTTETADEPEGGEGPARPERPEDRQLRDAGARD